MKDEAKRKEAKFSKNMARLICVAVMILTMGMMVGCGKGEESESDNTASETSEAIEEVEEENASEAVENAETLEPTETGETIEETEEQDTPAGSDAPQNIEEWVATLDPEENKVTIWNEVTNEGTLLEEGGRYVIKEGDLLVLINEACSTTTSEFLTFVGGCELYVTFECTGVFENYTHVNVEITCEPAYEINFFIISEGYEEQVDGYEDENSGQIPNVESEGEQWVMSLNYEEPKLVFWNDELGTQTVVEEGENYQMSDGDVMAVYLPEGCYIGSAVVNYEPMGLENKAGYSIIDYSTLAQNTTIELELGEVLENADMIFPTYIITTP